MTTLSQDIKCPFFWRSTLSSVWFLTTRELNLKLVEFKHEACEFSPKSVNNHKIVKDIAIYPDKLIRREIIANGDKVLIARDVLATKWKIEAKIDLRTRCFICAYNYVVKKYFFHVHRFVKTQSLRSIVSLLAIFGSPMSSMDVKLACLQLSEPQQRRLLMTKCTTNLIVSPRIFLPVTS